MTTEARIAQLTAAVRHLSETQFFWIESVIAQLGRPHAFWRNPTSDIITDCVLRDLGDTLRIHHCFSREAFSKDKFEYALERVLLNCGIHAEMASRGNPGHDLTIAGQRVSLKSQADKSINDDWLWISKFMELGRGSWTDQDNDLIGLRDQFFAHMRNYDRIFQMRMLKKLGKSWRYELVEIPKSLLAEAATGRLEMRHDSRQTPRPGYCHVVDAAGNTRFDLYFDGGGERKLQIRSLDKRLCIMHGTWTFEAG